MSFQTPISVSDAIYRIQSRTLLLPAIQREFVWEPGKVEWLFLTHSSKVIRLEAFCLIRLQPAAWLIQRWQLRHHP
jgi:hypothetical protein